MNILASLTDEALNAEIASARYFSTAAWRSAKRAARDRLEAKRRLTGPLTHGGIGYYQLRRLGLADELHMYLCARALYRARIAAAEAEIARRSDQPLLAA